MATYTPTSWGRTRRPKAPENQDKNFITGTTSLAALNVLSEANFTPANGCYRTENQRYVHITCSGSSEVTNLYAYNYAAGFWHEIVTGSSNSSVVVGNNQHQIVDINGADWVSIKSGSLDVVTMAFSTF